MQHQGNYDGYLAMAGPLRMRPPREKDAATIHALIDRAPQLDSNSCYTYLLQAWHFADTCVTAEMRGAPVGYVSAFIPPTQPDTLFIWQMLVVPQCRGAGLARGMVLDILQRPIAAPLRHIESTVAHGNDESEQFFRKLARHLNAPLRVSERLPSELFKPGEHEGERLFHIGPFDSPASISLPAAQAIASAAPTETSQAGEAA